MADSGKSAMWSHVLLSHEGYATGNPGKFDLALPASKPRVAKLREDNMKRPAALVHFVIAIVATIQGVAHAHPVPIISCNTIPVPGGAKSFVLVANLINENRV